MIYGFIHPGSGLGNQLFRYVATRTLAEDKGYDFSMINRAGFKGASFMNLDMGKSVTSDMWFSVEEPAGKVIPYSILPLWEEKTNYYNPEFNFIEDNTIIDGEFQDERYFNIGKVDEWLKTERLDVLDYVCVIGFRGGEFGVFPELFLPPEYWQKSVDMMRKANPNMKFEVHTDDEVLAKQFFPEFKIIHDVDINWRSMKYAKYAIIANSSFYILPRLLAHWLKKEPITIAPRFWARHNTGEWSMPQNYYKQFKYI